MSVCHPELSKFSTTATQWGCEHEQVAHSKYASMFEGTHEEFSVCDCGLFISTTYPFMGASPDGLVSCKCCGDGVCEIKVRYCVY